MDFDLIVAADWSASASPSPATPSKDAIWLCVDRRGARGVEYHRTRHAAMARIDALLGEGLSTLLGFDFAFGWPEGFAAGLAGAPEALAVWDWLAERLEDRPDNGNDRFAVAEGINDRFPGVGPFWGTPRARPGLPARDTRAGHGLPERRAVEAFAPGATPVWQLAYAGAVGSQSLMGCAALARLCRRWPEARVWPQETGFEVPDARVVVAEIYPSLFPLAPHAVKDAGQVLATAAALRAAPDTWWTEPGAVASRAVAAEEGWILGVLPPASCFALPPGAAWTPVETALAALRDGLGPVTGTETVSVLGAAGRVLARAVVARASHPPPANSAVDGWGFAHAALPPGPVPVAAGRAAAGAPFGGAVPPGRALRILTGAALPPGVDTVALQEDATVADGHVVLRAVPRAGANTRPAGEDLRAGDAVLAEGTVLRAPDVALAVAAGHGTLRVRARLRVGVLSTGDEIVEPGGDGVGDANRPMLLAMLEGWGLAAVDLGRVGDDADAVAAALDGAGCDAIVTSGGASDGDEDHLSRLLRARGGVRHWRVALKPGRPLVLGHWDGTPVFGLPGNPVAAFVCAAWFARPALRRMAGMGWDVPEGVTVSAAFSKRKKPGRTELLRARLDARGRAEVFPSEGSGRVSGLAWATGLVHLSHDAGPVAPGDPVRFVSYAALGIG